MKYVYIVNFLNLLKGNKVHDKAIYVYIYLVSVYKKGSVYLSKSYFNSLLWKFKKRLSQLITCFRLHFGFLLQGK